MTYDEIRRALLDELSGRTKMIRTNDGRSFRVDGVEQWALGSGRLLVIDGPGQQTLSIRNIASIGPPRRRNRRA